MGGSRPRGAGGQTVRRGERGWEATALPDMPRNSGKAARRIIGGSAADSGEHPWLAFIGRIGGVSRRCTGTVVADRWVLTAAHCLLKTDSTDFLEVASPPGHTLVTLGCAHLFQPSCRHVIVDKVVVHPCYAPTLSEDHDDLALLHLAEDAGVPPAQLNGQNVTVDVLRNPGMEVELAGWGATATRPDIYPETLHTVPVKTASQARCEEQNPKSVAASTMDFSKVVCTGGEAGKDSCKGDSGGPLLLPEAFLQGAASSDRAVVAGVLSKGSELPIGGGCGVEGKYAVYTLTAAYRQFIRAALSDSLYSCASCPCQDDESKGIGQGGDDPSLSESPGGSVEGGSMIQQPVLIGVLAAAAIAAALIILCALAIYCTWRRAAQVREGGEQAPPAAEVLHLEVGKQHQEAWGLTQAGGTRRNSVGDDAHWGQASRYNEFHIKHLAPGLGAKSRSLINLPSSTFSTPEGTPRESRGNSPIRGVPRSGDPRATSPERLGRARAQLNRAQRSSESSLLKLPQDWGDGRDWGGRRAGMEGGGGGGGEEAAGGGAGMPRAAPAAPPRARASLSMEDLYSGAGAGGGGAGTGGGGAGTGGGGGRPPLHRRDRGRDAEASVQTVAAVRTREYRSTSPMRVTRGR
ncbi:trypsin-like cysteine/serine peptidase domain-containing protein [Baffinella frigidus]|nr:trypsin-like cysteine/serine peptidase domain-containing protein [Cryptophyta sp. CCMP2293]